MNDADRPRFAQAMLLMAEVFNESISEARAEGYFESLRDLSILSVEKAARLSMRNDKFFPKPTELRQRAAPHLDAQLYSSWDRLCGEVKRVSESGGKPFLYELEPVVSAVWGTWEKAVDVLSGASWAQRKHWEERFKAVYTAQIQAREESDTPKELNP